MAELQAPAKLTLSLRITGLRADGMHLIDAEMVSLDLMDRILIEQADQSQVTMGGPASTALRALDPKDDLVARALQLVDRTARVSVEKNIPAGAGLGGGSSDAAAILRWAGFNDSRAAANLGADVAFSLVGGRARVTGIGEVIEPLPFHEQIFTLLTPPVHCSTPVVYRRWDEMGGPVSSETAGNDLTDAAIEAYPELREWRALLRDLTEQEPRLAGSGSTWFVSGAYEGPGFRVVRTTPALPLGDLY